MVVTNSPPVRRRRLSLRLVAGLLIGLVCTSAVVFWITRDEWLADAMAAADRDNPYWRLDDLMAHREQVPDAENSALVVAKAVELLPEDWPTVTVAGAGGSSTGKSSASNVLDRLQQKSENLRLDEALAGVLRTELKAHEAALELARTVGSYQRGRHEVVLTRDLIDTPLYQTNAVRGVARLLAADAAPARRTVTWAVRSTHAARSSERLARSVTSQC